MGLVIIIALMVSVYALVLVMLNKASVCTGKCVYDDCDCPIGKK